MRTVVFCLLVLGVCGCNHGTMPSETRERRSEPMVAAAPQSNASVVLPDAGIKAIMLVDGPTKKQLLEDVSNRKIPFGEKEFWTFKPNEQSIEVLEARKTGTDFVDVDLVIRIDTAKRTLLNLTKPKKNETEFVVRIMYERCGNRWVARNVVGLQMKKVP